MAAERVVITGGAGFLGTHLAERLCRTRRVAIFDNLTRDSLSLASNLRRRVEFLRGDVRSRQDLERAFSGARTIVHMAAIAGVSSYYARPLETLTVNLLGTVNALEAACAAGARRFIYVSTSEVFGPDALWVREGDFHRIGGVADRRWVYATSKLAGEQFVMRTAEAKGLAATILRPFNIYGPRQTGEGAARNFCRAAVQGRPLVVYGDGAALRAWCYVSDFIDAAAAAMSCPAAVGEDFNIGNPREVETTLGLARRVARLCPGARIAWRRVDHAEVRARVPCIDKARRLLRFKPRIDLDEGLRRTLADLRRAPRPRR